MTYEISYIKASFEPELNYVCSEKPVSTAIYLVTSIIYLAVFTITIYYFPVNSPCKRRVPKEKDNPQESILYLIKRLNNILGSLFVYMIANGLLNIYSCHQLVLIGSKFMIFARLVIEILLTKEIFKLTIGYAITTSHPNDLQIK